MAHLLEEGLLDLEDGESDGEERRDDENTRNDSLEKRGCSFLSDDTRSSINDAFVGLHTSGGLRLQARLDDVRGGDRARSNNSSRETTSEGVRHREVTILILKLLTQPSIGAKVEQGERHVT